MPPACYQGKNHSYKTLGKLGYRPIRMKTPLAIASTASTMPIDGIGMSTTCIRPDTMSQMLSNNIPRLLVNLILLTPFLIEETLDTALLHRQYKPRSNEISTKPNRSRHLINPENVPLEIPDLVAIGTHSISASAASTSLFRIRLIPSRLSIGCSRRFWATLLHDLYP